MPQAETPTTYTVKEVLGIVDRIFFGNINAGISYGHTLKQWKFKKELFRITGERGTKKPGECRNIDATAFLSKEEFESLIKEAESLR